MKKEINFKAIPTNLNVNEVEHWFETKSGQKWFLPYNFGIRVNLKDMTYTWDDSFDLPDLNELVANGTIEVKFAYTKIDYDNYNFPSRISYKKVVKFFKDKGFNVTEEAVRHNFEAWKCDFKSGYRDEVNGYHLFTPCGCNPLSFRLTTLHEPSKDWQITYEC